MPIIPKRFDGIIEQRDMNRQPSISILTRIRRPEYTGDNRCLPCTAVNLVLATALTGVVALVSPPVAAAVAAGSLASIYARGYLVPGTPELTKRYLPDRVLAWFGKGDVPVSSPDVDFDVVSFLDSVGVVIDDGDDVALAPRFERGLETAAFDLDTEAATTVAAADLLAVAPDRVSFVAGGASWRVLVDGSILGQWESRAAFVADLATHRTLSEWTDEWAAVPDVARGRTLGKLEFEAGTQPGLDDSYVEPGTYAFTEGDADYGLEIYDTADKAGERETVGVAFRLVNLADSDAAVPRLCTVAVKGGSGFEQYDRDDATLVDTAGLPGSDADGLVYAPEGTGISHITVCICTTEPEADCPGCTDPSLTNGGGGGQSRNIGGNGGRGGKPETDPVGGDR